MQPLYWHIFSKFVYRLATITHFSLSIPLNTNVVGGIITQTPLRLPIDLTFEDFFSRICAKMELDLLTAKIGCKLSGNHKADAPYQLANEDEFRFVMERVIDKIKRARTKEVIIELFNLVSCQ